MAIINKKWRKDASFVATSALARIAGAGATAAILKKVTDETFTSKSDLNKTIGNLASPFWTLLTMAGDLFLENPYLKSFCQGSYSFSTLKTLKDVVPVVGNYFGLSGADMPQIMNGVTFSNPQQTMNGIMNGTPAIAEPYTTAPQSSDQETFKKVAEYAEESIANSINGVNNSLGDVQTVAESML